MVLGGAALGVWGGFRRRIVTLLLAAILQGASVSVLGLAPAGAFPVAVGAVFLNGCAGPISGGSFHAIIQSTAPRAMQGRVFTLLMSVATAMSPLGMAIAGPVAESLGVQFWFRVGGIVAVIACAAAFLVPAVMSIEEKRLPLLGDQEPILPTGAG